MMPSSSQQQLYSVEQVAELLDLHVRTVRAYVREGRLKATRIGKQYRIAGADLEALVGGPVTKRAITTGIRHVDVSSIVDIDAISQEEAMRISNGLIAAANMHARSSDKRLRLDSSYDETRARLKLVVMGDLQPVRALLDIFSSYLEDRR